MPVQIVFEIGRREIGQCLNSMHAGHCQYWLAVLVGALSCSEVIRSLRERKAEREKKGRRMDVTKKNRDECMGPNQPCAHHHALMQCKKEGIKQRNSETHIRGYQVCLPSRGRNERKKSEQQRNRGNKKAIMLPMRYEAALHMPLPCHSRHHHYVYHH